MAPALARDLLALREEPADTIGEAVGIHQMQPMSHPVPGLEYRVGIGRLEPLLIASFDRRAVQREIRHTDCSEQEREAVVGGAENRWIGIEHRSPDVEHDFLVASPKLLFQLAEARLRHAVQAHHELLFD
jgi:hypothetical protein